MNEENGTTERTHVRALVGKVVSNKMEKTIAVEIERLIKHERYGKYIRRSATVSLMIGMSASSSSRTRYWWDRSSGPRSTPCTARFSRHSTGRSGRSSTSRKRRS